MILYRFVRHISVFLFHLPYNPTPRNGQFWEFCIRIIQPFHTRSYVASGIYFHSLHQPRLPWLLLPRQAFDDDHLCAHYLDYSPPPALPYAICLSRYSSYHHLLIYLPAALTTRPPFSVSLPHAYHPCQNREYAYRRRRDISSESSCSAADSDPRIRCPFQFLRLAERVQIQSDYNLPRQ